MAIKLIVRVSYLQNCLFNDCLITRSREVPLGGVTYYRRYIYTLSTQKADGPHI